MAERGIDYLTGSTKRRLDVVGGFILMAAALPVGSALSIGSALDTLNNPIFQQSRIGHNGDEFQVYKFRSIKEHEVAIVPSERGTNHSRASRFGKTMRKFGLDELPQLANVIKGDMSLVGFRPLLGVDIDHIRDTEPKLFEDWFDIYNATKPGLTGPGQIYRKKNDNQGWGAWKTAMQLDLDYAEVDATLGEDLKIIGMTPVQLIANHLPLGQKAID